MRDNAVNLRMLRNLKLESVHNHLLVVMIVIFPPQLVGGKIEYEI